MITIITYGDIKQNELAKLSAMYEKRIATLPSVRFKCSSYKETGEEEYEQKIRDLAAKGGHRVLLLTETGKTYDTIGFLDLIRTSFSENESFTFVIGPPSGFSAAMKLDFECMSLSALTFPHEVAQVLLIEQIYRVCSLYHGRQYHK